MNINLWQSLTHLFEKELSHFMDTTNQRNQDAPALVYRYPDYKPRTHRSLANSLRPLLYR